MALATVRKTDYTNTHVDRIVTSQAMEFFQSDEAFIGVRDVPAILVDEPTGILSVLDRDDMNRDEVLPRGPTSQAEKAGFAFKDLTYKTDERSLEYDLNAARQANASAGRDPAKVIPRALAFKGLLHTEIRLVSDVFASSKWFRTVTGNAADGADNGTHSAQNRKFWSDPTSDPIAALRFEIDIFIILTGLVPTNLRLGRQLFTAIAANPNVRAQVAVMVGGVSQTATFTPPATAAQIGALLGLKVSVSSAVQNTANKGEAAVNAFIVPSKDGLLSYDAPMQYTDGQVATAFARVVNQKLAPDGFQVRSFDRPEVGPGGSRATVLDIYNGFLVVDNKLGTYLSGMAQ
jgi:hypothetical protein